MTRPLRPPPIPETHRALMFPTLTPAQVARIAAHGTVRAIARGRVLIEAGDAVVPFFVVRSGRIDIIQPSSLGDVRGGNVKRVASAVGEGSIAVSFVHRVLAE